jgi:hypothetical protein
MNPEPRNRRSVGGGHPKHQKNPKTHGFGRLGCCDVLMARFYVSFYSFTPKGVIFTPKGVIFTPKGVIFTPKGVMKFVLLLCS